MAKKQQPDWDELNAYVDGELPLRGRLRVAMAVAGSGGIAKQTAALTQLKTTINEEFIDAGGPTTLDDLGIPPAATVSAADQRRFRHLWRSAAAVLVVGLVSALAALAPGLRSGDGIPPWLDKLQGEHRTWAASDVGETAAGPAANPLFGEFLRIDVNTAVPDLTSAKLTVGRVEVVANGPEGEPFLHVGYKGTRGCRVSFWAGRALAGIAAEFTHRQYGALAAFSWRLGELAYIVMAEGMDGRRIEGIARAAFRYTQQHRPLDRKTRLALAEDRAKSTPCIG